MSTGSCHNLVLLEPENLWHWVVALPGAYAGSLAPGGATIRCQKSSMGTPGHYSVRMLASVPAATTSGTESLARFLVVLYTSLF
jgi:hypothetical protein